jgi:hypothetical protein
MGPWKHQHGSGEGRKTRKLYVMNSESDTVILKALTQLVFLVRRNFMLNPSP